MSDSELSVYSCTSNRELSLLPPPVQPANKRPTRQRVLPAKLRDANPQCSAPLRDPNRVVIVRCSQAGKQHIVKVKDISKEDGVLSEKDFERGKPLILAYKGKHYPVSFLQFKDIAASKRPREETQAKREHKEKAHQACFWGFGDVAAVLQKAKFPQCSKENLGHQLPRTPLDDEEKGLLLNSLSKLDQRMERTERLLEALDQRMERTKRLLGKLCKQMKSSSTPMTAKEEPNPDENIVNGVNVMKIPAKIEYSYALSLMDIFFTKEELSTSLLFNTKESSRQGLDGVRVEKLVSEL